MRLVRPLRLYSARWIWRIVFGVSMIAVGLGLNADQTHGSDWFVAVMASFAGMISTAYAVREMLQKKRG